MPVAGSPTSTTPVSGIPQIDTPRPLPSVLVRAVSDVQERSKTRGGMSAGMPGPLSRTSMTAHLVSSRTAVAVSGAILVASSSSASSSEPLAGEAGVQVALGDLVGCAAQLP